VKNTHNNNYENGVTSCTVRCDTNGSERQWSKKSEKNISGYCTLQVKWLWWYWQSLHYSSVY